MPSFPSSPKCQAVCSSDVSSLKGLSLPALPTPHVNFQLTSCGQKHMPFSPDVSGERIARVWRESILGRHPGCP